MSTGTDRKPIWVQIGEKYYALKEKYDIPKPVKRKTYLWLCLLGIVGANQFYAGHWIKGLFYLALSWTGISIAMGFIDWMIALPKTPDENGMILM